MTSTHPSTTMIRQFLSSELNSEDFDQVLFHLAGGCSRCQELARGRAGWSTDSADVVLKTERLVHFDQTVARLQGIFEDRRRQLRAADDLIDGLLLAGREQREDFVRGDLRFQDPLVVEALLQRAHLIVQDEPRDTLSLAEIALDLALGLPRDSAELEDLRGLAWASTANAKRILGDLDAARLAFNRSRLHLDQGTGDPRTALRLEELEISLLAAQREFEIALRKTEALVQAWEQFGDEHRVGFAKVKHGLLLTEAAYPEEALVMLQDALSLIDRENDLGLECVIRQLILINLIHTERYEEAQVYLAESRPLFGLFPDTVRTVRIACAEALIFAAMGRPEEAEASFQVARQEYLERDMQHDAAMLGLELALIYGETGRFTDMRRVAEEAFPIFQERGMKRDALAAVILQKEALASEEFDRLLMRGLRTAIGRKSQPSHRKLDG